MRRRVPAAITTAFGSARACSRAARFGVSPTTACSWAAPTPMRSPTTTRPVAMPIRTCSAPRDHGCPTASTRQDRPEQPARHRLRVPRDSRSRRDPVAHVLGDKAVKAANGLGNAAVIRADQSRRSSGSSREASAVEPTRSQNITVSCRRSAYAVDCGGAGWSGRASLDTGPKSAPQSPQNFEPSGLRQPQNGQREGSGAPHSVQNCLSSGTFTRQLGHSMPHLHDRKDQGSTGAGAATIGLNKTGGRVPCHCTVVYPLIATAYDAEKCQKKTLVREFRVSAPSERATQLVRCGHWICFRSYFAPCPVCSGPSKYEALEAVGHRLPQFWRAVDQRTQAQNHGGYVMLRLKNRPPAAPHGIEQASLPHLMRPLLPTEQDT